MTYIANSLAQHERLVMQARFPWLLRAAAWAALIVLGFAPVLAWVAFALQGRAGTGLGILAAGVALVGLGVFVWLQLYMTFTETGVTDQRFVLKRGIIARHATDFPLGALENIDVDQTVIARLFGYGRLSIAGSGETDITTPPMQDPVTFRTALAEARIAVDDAPSYRARPVRIDPMSRENGAPVDERGRERHVEGRRLTPRRPSRWDERREPRGPASPPKDMR